MSRKIGVSLVGLVMGQCFGLLPHDFIKVRKKIISRSFVILVVLVGLVWRFDGA